MFKLLHNCTHLTCYQSMLKILQSRLQQYMNCALPNVQAGFRKGKGSGLSKNGGGCHSDADTPCKVQPRNGPVPSPPRAALLPISSLWLRLRGTETGQRPTRITPKPIRSSLSACLRVVWCRARSQASFKIKLPTSTGSSKKQESSRKTSTSALLTKPKPLTVWITTNLWKIL